MSVHFRNTCFIVDNVICKAECETKWNKSQPNLVMRGFSKKLTIKNGTATIG